MPYRLHTVLTDNGVQRANTLPDRTDPETEAATDATDAIWAARGEPRMHRVHAFDHACTQLGVEHRLTKPHHPWTNGQVERINRTLSPLLPRDRRSRSRGSNRPPIPLRQPRRAARTSTLFLDAYNYARRLKALRGLTPYEAVRQAGTKEPDRFTTNPSHHTPGLNS